MDRVRLLADFLNRIINDVVAVVVSAINYTASILAAVLTRITVRVTANVAITSYNISVFLISIQGYYTATITSFVTNISAANVLTYISVSAKTKIITGLFSSLLDYLNITTFLIIHRIRSTTHIYYREKMADIFQRLGVYSVAIHAGYSFLPNAFMNARNISLTASSSQGKSFDIGEIVWLRILILLLRRISIKSTEYAQKPTLIFMDIDELVIIPAINAKSGLQLATLVTIDNIGKSLSVLSEQQGHYTELLNNFIAELPEQILESVKPYINDVSDNLTNWINDDYLPQLQESAAEVTMLQSRQRIIQEQLKVLLEKLGLGGDILFDILNLPEPLRSEQLSKVNTVASHLFTERADNWSQGLERLG